MRKVQEIISQIKNNEKFIEIVKHFMNNPLFKLLLIINRFSTYIISPPKKKQSFEKYFSSTKTINMEKVAPKEENYLKVKKEK